MSEAEIPLDLSFVLELAKPPSLEEELQLEKENVAKIEKQLDAHLGKADKKHLSLTFKK